MKGTNIEFDYEQGRQAGYLVVPDQGGGPGVLVLHAWWGLAPVFKDVGDRLAQAGFLALAPDLYQGEVATTREQAQQLMEQYSGDTMYFKIQGAINYLLAHPARKGEKIGVVGFSMGSSWALMLDNDPIAAIVTFYGTNSPESVTAQAAIQGHFAEDDEFEPLDGVRQLERALRESGRTVDFNYYPAQHWFFEPDQPRYYDPQSANLAWERTIAFLRKTLVE